jgi:hypothetical protein
MGRASEGMMITTDATPQDWEDVHKKTKQDHFQKEFLSGEGSHQLIQAASALQDIVEGADDTDSDDDHSELSAERIHRQESAKYNDGLPGPKKRSSSYHEGDTRRVASAMKKMDYSLSSEEGHPNSGGNGESEAPTSFKMAIQEGARAIMQQIQEEDDEELKDTGEFGMFDGGVAPVRRGEMRMAMKVIRKASSDISSDQIVKTMII